MTKKWAKHRQRIISLYLDDNKPLHEVQSIMREQQNFTASTRAYRHRFMKWGLSKYSPQRRRTSISSTGSSYDAPEPTKTAAPLWPNASYAQAEPASPVFSSPEMNSYAQVYSPANTDTNLESTTNPSSPGQLGTYGDHPTLVASYPPSPPRQTWAPSPALTCQQQGVDGVSCVLPPIRAVQWGECCCCCFPSCVLPSATAAALPGFWEVGGSLLCGLEEEEQYVDLCYPRVQDGFVARLAQE
ncbi:hypothetical protein PpBr36_08093 [Pyricularia pennisetigena]|uniref:hypothetical protein n=1 Tax=Pyricularia pennisetigena TaxID=1578925 RepID=UPI0011500453|nr:hypothetical protein PpBr36_08093 [Pyricularia pennisetigena]TLS23988.1 hypothetical protein PpBr36_08093 [Pyricularia pennisetigena]